MKLNCFIPISPMTKTCLLSYEHLSQAIKKGEKMMEHSRMNNCIDLKKGS